MRRRGTWPRVERILGEVFASHGPVEVGRVRKLGEGLSSAVLGAWVEIDPDPEGRSGAYTVSLPDRHAEGERALDPKREALLMDRIAAATRAIRVPAIVGVWPGDEGHAVVRPYLAGVPLDLRNGRQPGVVPWEIVAEVAATIHGIDVTGLTDLGGYATRREHALAEIERISGIPALREAEQWCLANLPPEEPASLLHGDLLGQNTLLHPSEPPAVIDWEAAKRGDPAYDLAIVMRGTREPFQVGGGLGRLLDAYASRAGRRITAREVHLHELCIVGGWCRDVLEGRSDREPAEQAMGRVRGVLGRAVAAEARVRRE